MTDLMYTPLESVFAATMEREGRTVTAYTSGAEFQAFMRRNDDGDNTEDRITLFYAIDAPVIQGNLVSYGNKIYILVNRETEENNCYYKSSGLACNGMISTNDAQITGIPCYASDMGGGLAASGQTISVISGNMEFITESNSLSRQLQINQTFNEFGRTWKINNIYYKDGMVRLVTEVYANIKPVEILSIIIDGIENSRTYTVGDTLQVEATLYLNDRVTTGTIQWESSDQTIATVDGMGNVKFLSEGTVEIKAYWVEKDYTEKVIVNVTRSALPAGYYATIEGTDTIKHGFDRDVTAHLYYNGEEIEGIWEFTTNFTNPKQITTVQTGNVLNITIEDEYLIGEILEITARETTHNVTAVWNMYIISIF